MKEVTAFQASDGALFPSIEQCQEHEISLIWRERIDEFSASGLNPYPTGAHQGMCRKVIVAWEQFKTSRSPSQAAE